MNELEYALKEKCWINCRIDDRLQRVALTTNFEKSNSPEPKDGQELKFTKLGGLWRNNENRNGDDSTTPFKPPLGPNEQFYDNGNKEEDVNMENQTPPENVLAWWDYHHETDDNKTDAREIFSKIHRNIFIHQILNSKADGPIFVHGNANFKKVIVCGTIVKVIEEDKKFCIDDGTGQLVCIYDKLDQKRTNYLFNDYEENISSPFESINQYLRMIKSEMMKVLYPSRVELGDRVCVSGAVSFYKENFYLFVDKLESCTLNEHVSFMKYVNKLNS